MNRVYFKNPILKGELFKFCKENGANYFEAGRGVWIIPKKYGTSRIAVALCEYGGICFGKINESCENFEDVGEDKWISREEQKWIIQILTRISKYKPTTKKKK